MPAGGHAVIDVVRRAAAVVIVKVAVLAAAVTFGTND